MGAPDILVAFDAGYDVTRQPYLLADLLGRLRSDRVLYFPAPSAAGEMYEPLQWSRTFWQWCRRRREPAVGIQGATLGY